MITLLCNQRQRSLTFYHNTVLITLLMYLMKGNTPKSCQVCGQVLTLQFPRNYKVLKLPSQTGLTSLRLSYGQEIMSEDRIQLRLRIKIRVKAATNWHFQVQVTLSVTNKHTQYVAVSMRCSSRVTLLCVDAHIKDRTKFTRCEKSWGSCLVKQANCSCAVWPKLYRSKDSGVWQSSSVMLCAQYDLMMPLYCLSKWYCPCPCNKYSQV